MVIARWISGCLSHPYDSHSGGFVGTGSSHSIGSGGFFLVSMGWVLADGTGVASVDRAAMSLAIVVVLAVEEGDGCGHCWCCFGWQGDL